MRRRCHAAISALVAAISIFFDGGKAAFAFSPLMGAIGVIVIGVDVVGVVVVADETAAKTATTTATTTTTGTISSTKGSQDQQEHQHQHQQQQQQQQQKQQQQGEEKDEEREDEKDQQQQHNQRCETLKTALRYAQDKAPRDISAVLPLIVEKVNRELSGVVDVEVGWSGGVSFHSRVGDHFVRCSVTRLLSALAPPVNADTGGVDNGSSSSSSSGTATVGAKSWDGADDDTMGMDEQGRDTVTQCFDVRFRILDTDECALPMDHPMRHRCRPPSVCVNTVGSYECACPHVGSASLPPLPPREMKSGDGGAAAAAAADEAYFVDLEQSRMMGSGAMAAVTVDAWSASLNSTSASSCPGRASTFGCCDRSGHSAEGASCRASFHCPRDPCAASSSSSSSSPSPAAGGNECAPTARCVRRSSPLDVPNYDCQCPRGLMGNGRKCRKGIDPKPTPRVEFDGVTPTEETVRNGYYCGCTKPVVDACAGFPKCEGKHEICTVSASNTPSCECKQGYVRVAGYGCIDETPPILKLRNDPNGDGVNRLRQGDVYQEHAVEIVDENAEEYLRSLKIAYSRPLPPGCLTKTGRFHVNYTVATPWTSPPYVRVTRTVVIDDVDECSLDVDQYEAQCPELLPKCDVKAGARCVNTWGSYTCKCPEYTTGDGFVPIGSAVAMDERGRHVGAPEGYSGGTGCRDTSKPVVELLGPNPKILRVCKCGGLSGVMMGRSFSSSSSGARDGDGDGDGYVDEDKLLEDQRSTYGRDIRAMIESTAGAELCATHTRPNPSPVECVRASDRTHRGTVDLSSRVRVGEPVHRSDLLWRVPYDVSDDAGNEARTAWREVMVEEVELGDLERRIRDEVLADKERGMREAVAAAVDAERRRMNRNSAARTPHPAESGNGAAACPVCTECVCPDVEGGLSEDQCDAKCSERMSAAERSDVCTSSSSSSSSSSSFGSGASGNAAARNFSGTAIPTEQFHPLIRSAIRFADGVLSPNLVVTILFVSAAFLILLVLARLYTWLFYPRDAYYYTRDEDEREKALLNSVTYYRSPPGASSSSSSSSSAERARARGGGVTTPGSAPPVASMPSRAVGNGIFSPQENRIYGQQRMFSPQVRPEENGSMYQSRSPINPDGHGSVGTGGVGSPSMQTQATPFNLRRRY